MRSVTITLEFWRMWEIIRKVKRHSIFLVPVSGFIRWGDHTTINLDWCAYYKSNMATSRWWTLTDFPIFVPQKWQNPKFPWSSEKGLLTLFLSLKWRNSLVWLGERELLNYFPAFIPKVKNDKIPRCHMSWRTYWIRKGLLICGDHPEAPFFYNSSIPAKTWLNPASIYIAFCHN